MSIIFDEVRDWTNGITIRQLERLIKVNEYLVQEFGEECEIKPSPDNIKDIGLLYSTYEDDDDVEQEVEVSLSLDTMILTTTNAKGTRTEEVDDDFIDYLEFDWLYSSSIR